MRIKRIMMSVLLVMGFIAARAADGNPPELILVSQPVIVYNYNSVTVYYDVQNIGDYSYKGDICIYLDPDDGTEYAYRYVKVCPGKIKRVSLDIMANRLNPSVVYTIMPYYEVGNDLYSFTTFEYFEPIRFSWDGPRDATWIVTVLPPRPRFYTWPGDYRYYYDGFMPPMPPTPGFGPGPGPGPLPPPDPHHHTYDYHHHNGGYPGGHTPPPGPHNGGGPDGPGGHDGPGGGPGGNPGGGGNHNNHDGASVRPSENGGSMSHGNANNNSNGNGNGSLSGNDHNNSGSNSGRTGNSGNVNRPSGENGSHSGTTPNNGRSGSSNVSRPSNPGAGAGVRGGGRGGRGGGGRGRR